MKSVTNKKIITIVLTTLTLLAITAVFAMSNNNSNFQESKSVLGEFTQKTNVSVQVISNNELEVEASFGKKIVRLGVELSNNSNTELLVSPGLQTFLVGSNNKLYSFTAVYSTDQPIGGVVEAGTKIKMDLDFEIPETVSPKTFIFQKDATSPQVEVQIN